MLYLGQPTDEAKYFKQVLFLAFLLFLTVFGSKSSFEEKEQSFNVIKIHLRSLQRKRESQSEIDLMYHRIEAGMADWDKKIKASRGETKICLNFCSLNFFEITSINRASSRLLSICTDSFLKHLIKQKLFVFLSFEGEIFNSENFFIFFHPKIRRNVHRKRTSESMELFIHSCLLLNKKEIA